MDLLGLLQNLDDEEEIDKEEDEPKHHLTIKGLTKCISASSWTVPQI